MSKRRISIIFALLCLLLLGGCGKGRESDKSGTFIYYVNAEGVALLKEAYDFGNGPANEKIAGAIEAMKNGDGEDYQSVFPREVRVRDFQLEDTRLDIHFNSSYHEMKREREVLLRAAVVQTLIQIPGVEYIGFFVEDEPLADGEGQLYGYMRAEDFVQNTGSSLHSYQVGNLQLYFANEKGDKLVKEEVSVRYNSNMSIEKLIVEQLIKGPSVSGAGPLIPPETKVLGVSVKDSVCYVNLDEGFLNNTYMADPRLTVYSIVNSIIDSGNLGKVQISVNGETDIMYMDSVDLSKPLTRDLDIVEEVQE